MEWSLTRAALWGEVKDRLSTSAMGLSGGQQQRLCIARTIAVRPEVILLDEPTSALDPISTLKIEELIDELKRDFTIAIVTHNMQQAARCADQVAFFYLGEMVEVGSAAQMFTAPPPAPHPGIHHRPVRLSRQRRHAMSEVPQHLVRSYDEELKRLRNMMTEMGGIVENQVALAAEAIMNRDAAAATRAVEQDPKVDALEREVEQFVIRMLALRQPMAGDLRQIVAALKITGDLERIGDYAANVAKRSIVLDSVHPAVQPRRTRAHGAHGAGEPQADDRRDRRE